jgi:hypothetical protein
MSRISAQDFVGTRARFQRLRDYKLFTGWIEDFFGNKVTVSTNTQQSVEIGDEFRFEGFGHHISVVFTAKLDAIGKLDLVNQGIVTAVEGTNARIVEAKRVKFDLTVSGPVRFSASEEKVRVSTPDIFAAVKFGPYEHQGFLVDVGLEGVGMVLHSKVPVKENVDLKMETRLGSIEAKANVRYCSPDRDRAGMWRIGLLFIEMDRVNKPRWDRFMTEMS